MKKAVPFKLSKKERSIFEAELAEYTRTEAKIKKKYGKRLKLIENLRDGLMKDLRAVMEGSPLVKGIPPIPVKYIQVTVKIVPEKGIEYWRTCSWVPDLKLPKALRSK
jgi:hypothetical protein